MLRRDFTKSNKEYFKSNKIALISLAVFLIIGIVIFSIFGMNGNFEVKGCYEFNVTIGEDRIKKFTNDQREIGKIIDSYGGSFDTVSVYGEGDDTQYVVRYINNIKDEKIIEINKLVAEKLDVDLSEVGEHIEIKPVVKTSDYLFTAASILILLLVASIFAYVRYNGASCLAILLGSLIGTLSFMSITTLLRLSVGMNYLAMLVILNVAITYFAITIFENMHKSSWMMAQNYDQAISSSIKSSRFGIMTVSVATMAIGVLMVLFGTSAIKYSSLNILFMAVVMAAVAIYVIPFVWSVFISHCRKRTYKIKSTAETLKKDEQ